MLQLPLALERGAPPTLQLQLFHQIRRLILDGRLKPGMPVPSSRSLAETLGVSRNTVISAYERLLVEGYLETKAASRTVVSGGVGERERSVSGPSRPSMAAIGQHARAPRYPVVIEARRLVLDRDSSGLIADFFVGRPGADTFPHAIWRRLLTRQLAKGGIHLTQYGDPGGLWELRAAIADHLGPARGIRVTPDRVLIVNGIQEGMNVVSRLLIGKGTPVAIENPSYDGAAAVFESYGAVLRGVSVDRDGIEVAQLPRAPIAFLYVTASHQYPTGGTLPLERRLALLRWARKTGAYIVEDDYDSDFRYDGPPLSALAGLDGEDVVLYMGTFSKSIGAGLRLGYLVLPRGLVEPATSVKSLLNNGHSWLDQAALAVFIRSGAFAHHLRRIRLVYRARRDALLGALERHFGQLTITGAAGGMHVMWHLGRDMPTAAEVEGRARSYGVGVYTLRSGAAHLIGESPYLERGLILGYAAVPERQIAKGIARLVEAVGSGWRNVGAEDHP
jgi:GntR family transcriptional regulator / MocR family aminotransferase